MMKSVCLTTFKYSNSSLSSGFLVITLSRCQCKLSQNCIISYDVNNTESNQSVFCLFPPVYLAAQKEQKVLWQLVALGQLNLKFRVWEEENVVSEPMHIQDWRRVFVKMSTVTKHLPAGKSRQLLFHVKETGEGKGQTILLTFISNDASHLSGFILYIRLIMEHQTVNDCKKLISKQGYKIFWASRILWWCVQKEISPASFFYWTPTNMAVLDTSNRKANSCH